MSDANSEVKVAFPKCIGCQIVPCINLLRSWGVLEGGELYVMRESVRRKKLAPCLVGVPIYALCQCVSALARNEETSGLPLLIILWQCIRDLKCSVFLALSGHYRNAMQVLRPVIENFLAGLFFTYTHDEDAFEKWLNGEYKVPASLYEDIMGVGDGRKEYDLNWRFCIEYLIKKVVPREVKKSWRKLEELISKDIISPLNKYLHPHFEYFEVASERCAKCPAAVKYDKEALGTWLKVSQRILFCIFSYLLGEHGEILLEDDDSREALSMLITPPELEDVFLKSEEYKELVDLIKELLPELEKTTDQKY